MNRGATRRPWRALALALALAVMLPASARAHLQLERSAPAGGARLDTSPREVRIRFTQRVTIEYTRIVVTRADGAAVLTGPLVEAPGSDGLEFFVTLSDLVPGEYVVAWRTAGRDGHVVEGSFGFFVAGAARTDSAAAPPPAGRAAHEDAREAHEAGEQLGAASSIPATLVRWLNFVALFCIIGAISFRALVLPRASGADVELLARGNLAVWRFARVVAATAVVALLARLYMQSYALHGAREALSLDRIGVMLTVTGWGHAWVVQAVALGVFFLGLALALRWSAGWTVAALAAVAMAFVPALSGHAAAVEEFTAGAVLIDALHVTGGSVWLGTLAALLLAGVPAALAGNADARAARVAALVRAFSPVALVGAATAAATGTASALLHLDLPELTTTAYGRTLLIKLAVLAFVAATGFYNWRVVTPALGTDAGTARLRRSASFEVAVALSVLAVTAVLVALPTP